MREMELCRRCGEVSQESAVASDRNASQSTTMGSTWSGSNWEYTCWLSEKTGTAAYRLRLRKRSSRFDPLLRHRP